MEQHKVLLIIVSVTIVLAAVVGVGLWLFYPRDDADMELAQGETPEGGGFEWQPLDYLQGQGDVPGLEDAEAEAAEQPDEFEVTYGVLPEGEPAQGPDRPTVIQTDTTEAPAGEAPAETAEDAPSMVVVPSAADVAATTSGAARAGEAAARPAPTSTETTYRSSPDGDASAAPSVASTPDAELADRAYWVQAISSPNRDTVEQAQITLREHQLGSRILTKVIDNRTYYRLRVGPFAVRAEAEKFLGWVRAISGFADAMIFVDYNTPVLAARPN